MTAIATEANVQQAVPFFMVHDIEASLRFYVDGLGFRKTMEWTPDGKLEWCWLEQGGAAVMLQEYPKSYVPNDKLGIGVSVCFMCRDAITLYKEFKALGVDARRPFVGNGLWVTETVDPDGYRLAFESPSDAPEETEYTD